MTQKKNNPLILVIFFLIFVCGVLGTIAFVMQVMKPKSENFQTGMIDFGNPSVYRMGTGDMGSPPPGMPSPGMPPMGMPPMTGIDIYSWKPCQIPIATVTSILDFEGLPMNGNFDIHNVNGIDIAYDTTRQMVVDKVQFDGTNWKISPQDMGMPPPGMPPPMGPGINMNWQPNPNVDTPVATVTSILDFGGNTLRGNFDIFNVNGKNLAYDTDSSIVAFEVEQVGSDWQEKQQGMVMPPPMVAGPTTCDQVNENNFRTADGKTCSYYNTPERCIMGGPHILSNGTMCTDKYPTNVCSTCTGL